MSSAKRQSTPSLPGPDIKTQADLAESCAVFHALLKDFKSSQALRVATLQRVVQCFNKDTVELANFLAYLDKLKGPLVMQSTDKRQAVVKQACRAMRHICFNVASSLKDRRENAGGPLRKEQVLPFLGCERSLVDKLWTKSLVCLLGVVSHFLQRTLPLLMSKRAVVSGEAEDCWIALVACSAFMAMDAYQRVTDDWSTLSVVLDRGCTHHDRRVRATSFRCMKNLCNEILDFGDGPKKEELLDILQASIMRGASDQNKEVRHEARKCILKLEEIQPKRAKELEEALSQGGKRILEGLRKSPRSRKQGHARKHTSLLGAPEMFIIGRLSAQLKGTDAAGFKRRSRRKAKPYRPGRERIAPSAFVSKLLSFPNAAITLDMVPYLLHADVSHELFGRVSRVPSALVQELLNSEDKAAVVRHWTEGAPPVFWRDPAKSEGLQDSYRLMRLLTAEFSSPLMMFLGQRLRLLVLHLLAVFHPCGRGNFFHVAAILNRLLQQLPSSVFAVLASPEGRVLLPFLLDRVEQAPVSSVWLLILCADQPTASFLSALRDLKPLERLLSIVCDPSSAWTLVQIAADLLEQCLDRMTDSASARLSMAVVFADAGLIEGESNKFLILPCDVYTEKQCQNALAALINPSLLSPPRQSVLCSLLRKMVKATQAEHILAPDLEQMEEPRGPMDPIITVALPNPLLFIKDSVKQVIASNLVAISKFVFSESINPETPEFHVFFEFLVVCAEHSKVHAIPLDIWALIVERIFVLKRSNFYLLNFVKLLVLLLRTKGAGLCIEYLLSECKLWSRLVKFYEDKSQPSCCLKAIVILIGNHLRLSHESCDKEGPLVAALGRLREQKEWVSFENELMHQSLLQVRRVDLSSIKPVANLEDTPPMVRRRRFTDTTPVSPVAKTGREKTWDEDDLSASPKVEQDLSSVMFGSQFAKDLGYDS